MNTSVASLVSSAVRFSANESNATWRPSAEIDAVEVYASASTLIGRSDRRLNKTRGRRLSRSLAS
jgi:hypothetical protein